MSDSIETVTISGLASGGAGVARLAGGMVVFTHGAYPGDVAQVRLKKVKKRFAEAELVRLEAPSPQRRVPECPHAQDCGGCEWMGLDISAQHDWKKTIVTQALARIGGTPIPEPTLTASPAPLGYRHRVRVKGISSDGGYSFAYRRRGSAHLAPIKSCAVAHPRINQVMAGLAGFLAGRPKLAQTIAEMELETDGSRLRAILHSAGAIGQSALEEMITTVEGLDGVAVMAGENIAAEQGQTWLNAWREGGFQQWLAPGAFSQANLSLNFALVERVLALSGLEAGSSGLDLFCGAGNYTIPLAAKGVAISGVDASAQAIASADKSRSANSLFNVQFTQEDCLQASENLLGSGMTFGAVIINPPRAGAGEVFSKALQLARERVVYVACDPAPLARDAATAGALGWSLERIEIFDMFPHTPHMETLALFRKNPRAGV